MSASIEIKAPSFGESITEATVARWLKNAGDAVTMDETLVELETDKVTLDISAPATGILGQILIPKGGIATVGDVLGIMTEEAVTDQKSIEKITLESSKTEEPSPQDIPNEFRNLDLKIRTERPECTETYMRTRGSEIFEDQNSKGEGYKRLDKRVPLPRLRQRIAERLKQAQNTAAILTTFNEADMSAVIALRSRYKDAFEKKHGIKLGFMSFFVKACLQALKETPAVNAEIDGAEIVYKNYYDIGVAISAPQGLVVPVLRDADLLSLAEIETNIALLGTKAKTGKLSVDDLSGGTFTISNGGIFGSLLSTPILNPPQSGILGMHKIQDRPVAINGRVEIRPMMYLALSYDHRLVDGREAVTFLVTVKECIENPGRFLLDL
ncbi:MAG: dihydrolipoyllysine-residue succinyltransferase [Alphaproteobacteria bacterium]|nr:dihydrolipoyllysine-residue succinyltransferase [Alphaproteobacteria bacterium]